MKKGELKKKEFLKAAELRFCRNGFEKTSVQDILDDLHTSKGSFYHHFVSKEALLGEICRNRAEAASEETFRSLQTAVDPCTRLNVLISGMIPFSRETIGFLLMLIPVFSGPEGITIRNGYTRELEYLYGNEIAETLREGTEQGVFLCPDPVFFSGLLMQIINRFWLEICDRIMENEKESQNTDPGFLMTVVRNYRTAVERLLNAPYGSVTILGISELKMMTEQIHLHWKA